MYNGAFKSGIGRIVLLMIVETPKREIKAL
jgi:hypothetical protein